MIHSAKSECGMYSNLNIDFMFFKELQCTIKNNFGTVQLKVIKSDIK